MSRCIISGVLLLAVIACMAFGQGLLKISDEDAISLRLDQLRSCVMDESKAVVLQMIAEEAKLSGSLSGQIENTSLIDSAFAANANRQTAVQRPGAVPFNGFWDFDIQDADITIIGDSAFVDCRLILHAQKTSDRSEYSTMDRLLFVREERGWMLAGCDNLFEFLIESGVKDEEE